jgi:APA family basic amino acid/polyamine antiporter
MGLEKAPHEHALDWSNTWQSEIMKPSYAILLVYVMYAFSGWNAAAYIVEEIKSPARNLPRALIGGTILVSVLFIALQLSFLMQAPTDALQGKLDIALVVTERMFGEQAGRVVSVLIALLLIASISAMTWVGPRVVRAMANDFQLWRFFGKDNNRGIPVRAIWLQTAMSSFMVLTSSFEKILLYSGFVLQLFTTLTVIGVMVLRYREGPPKGYRSPAYPLFQVLFLLFSIGLLVVLIQQEPENSLWGFVNVALGAGSYWWNRRHERNSGILQKNTS